MCIYIKLPDKRKTLGEFMDFNQMLTYTVNYYNNLVVVSFK